MPYLILAIILLVLYITAIQWFFIYVAPPLTGLGIVAAMAVVFWLYLTALRRWLRGELPAARNEKPIGKEPAYKNYFFRRAYADVLDIWNEAWQLTFRTFNRRFRQGFSWIRETRVLFTWPLGIVLLIILFATVVGTVVAFLGLGLLHLFIVLIVCCLMYLAALYLRTVERISMLWRRATFECPHTDCYRRFGLPYYRCECGEIHRQLIPGSYGIVRRRCKCARRLPTSGMFRRSGDGLRAYCPHCDGELTAMIGTVQNIHVPLVGGRSTGKSTIAARFAMAVHDLFQQPKRSLSFPVASDHERYAIERAQLEHGNELRPTAELSPRANLLLLREPNRSGTLLYMYDAAGELYQAADDERRRQHYLKRAAGFMLLIDPFSIPTVRQTYAQELDTNQNTAHRISTERPQHVFERLIQVIRHTKDRPQRMSVVITKADLFDLPERLQLAAPDSEARSNTVRQWLVEQGENNLVQLISNEFRSVHYFAAALQGPLAEARFVLEPARWVLGPQRVIEAAPQRGLSWRSPRFAYFLSIMIATLLFLLPTSGLAYVAANNAPTLLNTVSNLLVPAPQPTAAPNTASAAQPTATRVQPTPTSIAASPTPAVVRAEVRGVAPERLRVRSEPNAQRDNIIGRLNEGTVVEVISDSLVEGSITWYRIRTPAIEGWVSAEFLRFDE
jgi:hypothetical protein